MQPRGKLDPRRLRFQRGKVTSSRSQRVKQDPPLFRGECERSQRDRYHEVQGAIMYLLILTKERVTRVPTVTFEYGGVLLRHRDGVNGYWAK